MAVCSKALPLTASHLSPLPGFVSRPRKNLFSDMALGNNFPRVFRFPLALTTG